MAIIVSNAISPSPSSACVNGVDRMSFFLAGIRSAFGPLVAALLADEKLSQRNIGCVLNLGGPAGLLGELPGGELLHAPSSERFLIAPGGTMVAVSALVIAHWPNRPVVFAALMLQGLTGGLSVQLSRRSAKVQSVVTSFCSTARGHRREYIGRAHSANCC